MPHFHRLIVASLLLLASALGAAGQAAGDATRETQRLNRVAQVAQQEGRYEDAAKAYETVAVIAKSNSPVAAGALVEAGNLDMRLGRVEQAAQAFRKALAL